MPDPIPLPPADGDTPPRCGAKCGRCSAPDRCQYCGACPELAHMPACPGLRGGIPRVEAVRVELARIIAAAPDTGGDRDG